MENKSKQMYSREGIGTHWWFELLGESGFPAATKRRIDTVMDDFHRDYTRFTDTSYVGRLNGSKTLRGFPGELYDMMVFAKDMYRVSDGVFDISVGGALHALGYGDRSHAAPVAKNFWHEAKLNRDEITIPRESAIDLGGLGKGWLIDKLVGVMRDCGHDQFIVNGGGDMYVQSDRPIDIALQHPIRHDEAIGSVPITRGALAVSSTRMRTWQHDGATHHHIIDPTTGQSTTSDIISTYVRADTALIADVMATILLIKPELNHQLSSTFHIQTILLRKDKLS